MRVELNRCQAFDGLHSVYLSKVSFIPYPFVLVKLFWSLSLEHSLSLPVYHIHCFPCLKSCSPSYISKSSTPPSRSCPDPTSFVNLFVTDYFLFKHSLPPPNFYFLYCLFCLMALVCTLYL